MLAPLGASAQWLESKPGVYLAAHLDRHSLGEADNSVELRPVVGSASVGYWVKLGIGLELEAGVGVVDDSVGSLDLDFKSHLGVNLRLESLPVSRFAAYALFGYVRSSYDVSVDGSSSSITLPGGRLSFGMTYMINPFLRVDAGFTHHDYDGETRVNSFRFGLRYDLDS